MAFGAALALALGACAGERTGSVLATAPAAAPRVTGPAVADRDHRALVEAFGGEYRAPALKALVDDTVARLVAASESPNERYEVTLLDTPRINAFALPSGRLYVTRGVLALASDSAGLAAVLAHEMAHVTERHASLRGELEARDVLVSRVAADLLGDPAAGAAIRDRSRLRLAGFSRGQELEADRIGIATAARAGFDPHGAVRLLRGLGRHAELDRPGPQPASAEGGLSAHPATAERVALALAAARRAGAPGSGRTGRAEYLSALDGIAYGENPRDGVVRGRRFIHPRLGVTFAAPAGMELENTPRAVLGSTADGRYRLLFDAVEVPEGQSLQELLLASWTDAVEPGSVGTVTLGGRPVALASSSGRDWTFRLAAARVGDTSYRLVLAGRGGPAGLDRLRDEVLNGLRDLGPEEEAAARPHRLALAVAAAGDTAESLAARMATGRGLDTFLTLNGLERGERVEPGERYKIVTE